VFETASDILGFREGIRAQVEEEEEEEAHVPPRLFVCLFVW
jgi:hypothetical protein